jgi:hypothetical protein
MDKQILPPPLPLALPLAPSLPPAASVPTTTATATATDVSTSSVKRKRIEVVEGGETLIATQEEEV